MSTEKVNFTTPKGRLVGGSLYSGDTKDDKGNILTFKSGPRAGEAYTSYSFGVAFLKTDAEFAAIKTMIESTAKRDWPQGQSANPAFSWKITDGDSAVPNLKGNAPCNKEGYPNHWVLWFSGNFPPKVYDDKVELCIIPDYIKKGYYVRVAGSVNGNENVQKPGVYMNYEMVKFEEVGTVITTGPDAKAAFGAPATPATPAAPVAPVTPPAAPVAPPAAPVAPPAAPAPFSEGPEMCKDGMTVQSRIDVGWTREQMKEHGFID